MGYEIVCCMAAKDMQVYNHLMPIALHPEVDRLWVVRHERAHKAIPKTEYAIAQSPILPIRLLKALWQCIRAGRRPEVLAFVTFNPLPYGLIAQLAGWLCRKPVHHGFIGPDWFHYAKRGWGRPFLPVLRRGDFFTTTGEGMRREMVYYGFDPHRIKVLLHSIDLHAFEVNDPESADFDFIFVGQLIPRKRVDTILDAFARVVKQRPQARLCVLGGGVSENDLRDQAHRLGLDSSVEFPGLVHDVPPYVRRARSIIIASDDEGFPFALVEGMSSGLVPISTPVGTVTDFVRDGENGFIFPVGDDEALSRIMLRLIDDPELHRRLRNQALEIREHVGYEAMTKLWGEWFEQLRAERGLSGRPGHSETEKREA